VRGGELRRNVNVRLGVCTQPRTRVSPVTSPSMRRVCRLTLTCRCRPCGQMYCAVVLCPNNTATTWFAHHDADDALTWRGKVQQWPSTTLCPASMSKAIVALRCSAPHSGLAALSRSSAVEHTVRC
jgi:hypothetical protein